MNLSYKENYWDLPELKREYVNFLVGIFGLDLSPWDKRGFWDRKYRPFSYFDGASLVSNVCVYSMDMTVLGRRTSVAQISAVGTVPEYRRRGLSIDLTRKAIDWARENHDFFFLFADQNAHGFYQKCGFRPVEEYKARISVQGKTAKPGAISLDVTKDTDVELIYRHACEREPVSDGLGVRNPELFMFWCLCNLGAYIHYIPDLDILALYKRENGLVTIYDLVGPNVPPFSVIYPWIGDQNDKFVEFLFMTDKLSLGSVGSVRVEGNGTHVLGDFPLNGFRFIFPFTAHA